MIYLLCSQVLRILDTYYSDGKMFKNICKEHLIKSKKIGGIQQRE